MKRLNFISLLFAFVVFAFCSYSLKSQILFNNGAIIYIDTATTIQVNGGFQDDNLIGGPGTCTNNGNMVVTSNGSWAGNIYISNNAVLQGNGKYFLDQNWINDAVFNANNGTIEMDGNLKELITSDNNTVTTFDTLILSGTGTNFNRRKQLTLNARVSGALLLNDRVLFTAGHTMFITTPNTTAVTNNIIYPNEGFVSSTGTGSLSRITNSNSSYYFPVGADSVVLRYRKVLLTPASHNTNTYTVRLANNDATNNGDNVVLIDTSLCKVNPLFYHIINRTSGNDSTDIDIFYDAGSDGPWYKIAQWNTPTTTLWNNLGIVNYINASPYSDVLKRKWANFGNVAFILGASTLNVSVFGKSSICSGETTTLNASGATNYLWNTGDTTSSISVNPTSSTKYLVSVTNGECTTKDSITVNVNPLPVPNVCCDSTIILGQKVQLITTGGHSYGWSPPARLSCNNCPNPIANPIKTTTYTVALTSDSGCSAIDSVTITVLCHPVTVCCDSLITQGGNVQLISSGGNSYLWSPSTGLSCDTCNNPLATPSQNTTYTVTINDSGCISTRTVTIDVSCGDVFVPDAFSPNQNVNNILYVRGPCIASIDFIVFDRWGNKVFESNDMNNGWNGAYNGSSMNTGTYIYYVKASLFDGTTIEKKGNVTLVR